MAIWRIVCMNGRVGKARNPTSASGRVADGKMKPGRLLSLLAGILLLGGVAKFSEMPPAAQASLLDDAARTASTTGHSLLSSDLATYDEVTGNTAGWPMRVPVAGQGTQEENDTPPRRVAARAEPASGNPLWQLPLKQLSSTRERPIFSPSRRPPAPAPTYVAPVLVRQPAKPPEPERLAIALAGTIIGTDGYRMAVFRDTSTQDGLRLRVGENYHGWVVRLITSREANLVKDGEQAVLELPAPGAAPSPARSSRDVRLDEVWKVGAD
jgi:general secretion pathway protein N